jgi:hypothetical protein
MRGLRPLNVRFTEALLVGTAPLEDRSSPNTPESSPVRDDNSNGLVNILSLECEDEYSVLLMTWLFVIDPKAVFSFLFSRRLASPADGDWVLAIPELLD